ncbi:rho GTPase-activating protein 22 isoform X10 [Macaca nemestrina]|uniref:rho GTPase-activating protein 22 isoform X10 n=1 Tax=Macaca nemestrina TaxID=9545 RepID=UPI0039B93BAF
MLPTASSKRRTFAARYFTRSKSLVMGEQSRSPGRTPCPHRLGPVLKAGWLKKQRSIMKNWQQRWFVLRGDQLFYYKDKDEIKPQGFISLQGTQVTELPPGPEDPGKHLFEISPDRDSLQEQLQVLEEADHCSVMGTVVPGSGRRCRPTPRRSCSWPAPSVTWRTGCRPSAGSSGPRWAEHNRRAHGGLPAEALPAGAPRARGPLRQGTLELAKQVSNLPQANYNLLRYICKFLDEVQAYSNVNKMSVQNLATVFGPNILRPQVEDPVTIMEGTSLVQHLMTVLIRKHGQLFTAPAPEGSTSPRRGPQCAVGWGSEEVTRDSQGQPCDPGLPAHRTSSLDGAAVAVLSRTAPTGPGSRCSPGKKVQTLPSWKSSFRQPGSRSGSPKGGGSSLEVPIISSGGNWFMNGLSSLRGHRRASSGDRLKDSGSVQRLSTYDNVPAPGLVPGIPSVASMVWSGASSESSVGGSLSSCTACRASDSSARSSLHTDWALEPSPLPSSSEDPKSLDLDHSLDETGTGASNSEPSEPGSPTREHARRSEALQGLVTELRAELCRQRTEYERSVKRIEEGSADLRKRMSQLEEELDQEKKKYIMLEIKLRNSERAREDAERRNQLLQREMEEFFSTLGSLTVGAKGARAPK